MVGKAGLISVVGFAIILGFLSLNIARLSKNSTANMSSYADATLSHNLSQVGANIGLARFYADTTWYGDTTQNFNGPHFYGSVRYSTTALSPGNVRLRSISTYRSPSVPIAETLHDTVDVYFNNNRTQTFSIFAWMTNNENGVNWTTADTVWGRVHSNSNLTVNGSPVFFEKVTTTGTFTPACSTKSKPTTNKAIFKKSYETGVASVDLPTSLHDLDSASSLTGTTYGKRYMSDSIWVDLKPGTASSGDGLAIVHKTSFAGPVLDTVRIYDVLHFDGVIASKYNIHVKGTLDGMLSLASLTQSVVVEDNVRYETNPQVSTSDDLLGLIGDQNVVVADNAANNTDCAIDGCVFTRAGGFTAQNYDKKDGKGNGILFGRLDVLGSIVQKTRGPVGTISGSTLNTGFSKRYRYDSRLSDPNFRPPCFPGYTVKTYAITNWWESFRVPSISQ